MEKFIRVAVDKDWPIFTVPLSEYEKFIEDTNNWRLMHYGRFRKKYKKFLQK